MNRIRNQIIDLSTGIKYINESVAESNLGISRYFIRKSLKEEVPVKNDLMFAYYSYGMDIDNMIETYKQNYNMKRNK